MPNKKSPDQRDGADRARELTAVAAVVHEPNPSAIFVQANWLAKRFGFPPETALGVAEIAFNTVERFRS